MKLKINSSDIIKGKFANTIAIVEGFIKESEGDIKNNTNYRASSVNQRMKSIKQTLYEDLQNLANQLELSTDEIPINNNVQKQNDFGTSGYSSPTEETSNDKNKVSFSVNPV
jgi:hypothetical protein